MEDKPIVGVSRRGGSKTEGGVGKVASDALTKPEGMVNQGIGKIQSAIGSAIEQISVTPIADRAATLAKQATAAGGKAAGAVQDAAQKVSAQAEAFGGRVTDGPRGLAQYVAEQPLTSVLIAAAIGYGLARLLHVERRLTPGLRSISFGTSGVSPGDAPVAMPLGAV